MKELSIEEKAKAYDELCKKIAIRFGSNVADEIFSEYEESEDERIRKEMIFYFQEEIPQCSIQEHSDKMREFISWLKRQEIECIKLELKAGNSYFCYKSRWERADNETFKKGLIYKCNKDGVLDNFVIKNPEQHFIEIKDERIAWLEKQGEQELAKKYGITGIGSKHAEGKLGEMIKEKIETENVDNADKIEPKFHEGDWVVLSTSDGEKVVQVDFIEYFKSGEPSYVTSEGRWFGNGTKAHLWTIQDAKDGDVLVSESTCGLGTWYCIFKSLDGDESMTVYCYLTRDGRFETKKELCFDKDPYNTKPATKEQRDQLEKAMADAGWEFDFEKKELKKAEQTSANETPYPETLEKAIDLYYNSYGNGEGEFEHLSLEKFRDIVLTFVSDYGQKPAWSEEELDSITAAINNLEYLKNNYVYHQMGLEPAIIFLKSLKDRYTWKPSEGHYELEEFAKIVRSNLTGISKAVQKLFEAKYLQLTGNKMYGGFKD